MHRDAEHVPDEAFHIPPYKEQYTAMTDPNMPPQQPPWDQQPGQPQPQWGQDPKAAAKAQKVYAKASRPLYKKKRLLIPAALLVIAGCSASTGSNTADTTAAETKAPAASKAPASKAPAKPAEPAIVISSKKLIAVLESNALKAKSTYNGKQVTVSGFVGDIDASGKYFALDPEKEAFIITGVQVQISDKFQDQVANFSKGQAVMVTGEITNVGELIGYQLEAETIK